LSPSFPQTDPQAFLAARSFNGQVNKELKILGVRVIAVKFAALQHGRSCGYRARGARLNAQSNIAGWLRACRKPRSSAADFSPSGNHHEFSAS
jgi:hypothetical protein